MSGRLEDPSAFRAEIDTGLAWPIGCVTVLIAEAVLLTWGALVVGFDAYPAIRRMLSNTLALPEIHWAARIPLSIALWPVLIAAAALPGIVIRWTLRPFLPDTFLVFDEEGVRVRKGRRVLKSIEWKRDYTCTLYRARWQDAEYGDADIGEDVDERDEFSERSGYAVIEVEQDGQEISLSLNHFPAHLSQASAIPDWPEGRIEDAPLGEGHDPARIRAADKLLTRCGYPPPPGWIENALTQNQL